MNGKVLVVAVFVLCSLNLAVAQANQGNSEESLGDLARQAKSHAKSKVVINEDTPSFAKSPFPDIFTSGISNQDEILSAMDTYRKTHTIEETETAVHKWYDVHDAMLASAIAENKEIEDRQTTGGYQMFDKNASDYEQYQKMQSETAQRVRDDQRRKKENGLLEARIQNTFTVVRGGLRSRGMKYDWFKIRCGNGNCSF